MRQIALFLLTFLAYTSLFAEEKATVYDETGKASVRVFTTKDGTLRLYGTDNKFLGTVSPSRSGGYRIYGSRGEYKGSVYDKKDK